MPTPPAAEPSPAAEAFAADIAAIPEERRHRAADLLAEGRRGTARITAAKAMGTLGKVLFARLIASKTPGYQYVIIEVTAIRSGFGRPASSCSITLRGNPYL